MFSEWFDIINYFLFLVSSVVLVILGIVGSVVPAIPGPPLSFCAILITYCYLDTLSTETMLWMLAITILVSVLDYIAPIWLTKLGGGSKRAIRYSTIGMFVGLFFMPFGLILGPLFGAFLGEITESNDPKRAIRVSLMSFVAFFLTIGLKLIAALLMFFFTFDAIFLKQ